MIRAALVADNDAFFVSGRAGRGCRLRSSLSGVCGMTHVMVLGGLRANRVCGFVVMFVMLVVV